MAKQVSKTVIGVFVVSSIAMLIAGVIIFGSGEMFKKTVKFVIFFEDSVKGLSVGAPVIWHGVEIGSVSSIVLKANPEKLTIDVPVVIEIDPKRMEVVGKRAQNPQEQMKRLISKGLRARLALQSIVTGSSMVEVEFLPGTPVRLTGLDNRYPEIPTVKAPMDKLLQKLQDLPVEKIAGKLVSILDHLDNVLADPEIKEIVSNLNVASKKLDGVLENADKLVLDANAEVKQISGGMQTTMTDAQKALQDTSQNIKGISTDARKLLKNVNGQVEPLSVRLQTTLTSAKKALDQAKITLSSINGFVGDRSDSRHKLNRTLDEIGAAAKSLRSLMDYLERHPEALLQGKGGSRK